MEIFTKIIFMKTIFILLLQYIVKVSGEELSANQQPSHHSLETDKSALLTFKRAMTNDPHSILSNWNETTHVCNFARVNCNRQHHRVTRMNFTDAELVGTLPPVISNLTRLRVLILVNNDLFGNIPTEMFSLSHLRWLWLEGNKLTGKIPESVSLLRHLTYLNLRANNLAGGLPVSFFSNCTLLKYLDVSINSLSGNIPGEVGNCRKLLTLELYNNQFTGILPRSLANASQLWDLDMEFTHISGELPSEIVSKLPELVYLHLSYTHMYSHDNNTNLDPFFSALGNCTYLKELELAGMGLGGALPISIGRLGTYLGHLFLQENNLCGPIPSTIANLTNLTWLNLTFNFLSGTLPSRFRELLLLEQLFLSHNFFTGQIPTYFGEFPHLGLLDLSYNTFSGEIPKRLCNLEKINFLFLNNNLLSGSIPPAIGKYKDLSKLDLSYNQLTGGIPAEISNLREIRIFLNLSNNFLNGSLPIELSKLDNVSEMDLSSNNFTGDVIPQLGSCISLTLVNLSRNLLQGQLPEDIDKLINLETLDVSHNYLSGKIPESLTQVETLSFLNFSYNNFNGKIPSDGIFGLVTYQSFLGNQNLCGSIPGIQKCHQKINFHSPNVLITFCIILSIVLIFPIVCCGIACRNVRRIISVEKRGTVKKSPPEIKFNFQRITYKELSEATLGFSEQRLIGSGGYGHVYKGVLSDGTSIAVKVLQFQTGNSTKSFDRECQVLKRIRHRNLIRIITTCSLPNFKAIVLPYMSNGSLESRLHQHSDTGIGSWSSDLNLIQRVNVCSDIAEGLAYLHHHSPVRVIHCDLKPSNILLNDDMTALVSDFGIARLIMMVEAAEVAEHIGISTANIIRGSIGYIAPEYGLGSSSTTRGDVYSFGILVLEMMTRKRPTNDMFVGDLSLPRWVKSHFHGGIEMVLDSSLLRATGNQSPEVKKMWEVAMWEMIELGILCTQDSPSTRPTMLDAADDLDQLKRYLSGDTTVATFASSLGMSSSTFADDL